MFERKENKFILNRAFFGKVNCLKVLMNSNKEVYFHLGIKEKETWNWKKVKMSDIELGEIINVLNKDNAKCSFFHSFKDVKTQIWCNKSETSLNIKINTISKNLNRGEFEILRIILEECIRKINFN